MTRTQLNMLNIYVYFYDPTFPTDRAGGSKFLCGPSVCACVCTCMYLHACPLLVVLAFWHTEAQPLLVSLCWFVQERRRCCVQPWFPHSQRADGPVRAQSEAVAAATETEEGRWESRCLAGRRKIQRFPAVFVRCLSHAVSTGLWSFCGKWCHVDVCWAKICYHG